MSRDEAYWIDLTTLQESAYAEHQKNLDEMEAQYPEGFITTCDVCPCGMHTGGGSGEKCRALGILQAHNGNV